MIPSPSRPANRLAQPAEPLPGRRPGVPEHRRLVHRLAAPDAEEDAVGEEQRERRHRLRDDRGVVAERGRHHARPEPDPLGALPDRAEPGERERRVAARVAPRVEVVADDDAVEAKPFRRDAELEQLARTELLGRSLPSEREHALILGAHTSAMHAVQLIPVVGMPEVVAGDDVAALILAALRDAGSAPVAGDVLAVAQKVVSKSEGRTRRLADVVPGDRALRMGEESGKDPRILELVLGETARIIRWQRGVFIVETRHGFVCANAGVDHSNAGAPDTVVLLPVDPDASAARIRSEIRAAAGVDVPVVITDTFGRAWREGHMNVAIGISGLPALRRYAGEFDPEGYELRVTEIAIADEIAAATELVMGKLDRRPAAIVRGLRLPEGSDTAREYVRPAERDMFR